MMHPVKNFRFKIGDLRIENCLPKTALKRIFILQLPISN